MIASMNKLAPVVLWIILIAFILTIFLAWGMDFTSRRREPMVGKVGKTEIPLRYFDRMVGQEREKLREQAGRDVSPYEEKMVPRRVWETEVSRILHREVFKKMALTASADEVFEYIRRNPPPEVFSIPAFQTDGVFDTSKFVEFLNRPESFDNEGMRQLEAYTAGFLVPMEKLRRLLEAGCFPSREEIAWEYRRRTEKAVFEFAKVNQAKFAVDSSAVDAAMARAYYAAHPDTFFSEPMAELYFIRVPKKATAADEKSYYDDLMEIRGRIVRGESTFEEEAERESDDEASGKQGGDLGWFERNSMVPEFEEAAFALDSGQVSEPVKTRFGFHLIKSEGRKKQDTTVQVHARHILRKVAPTMETLDSLESYMETVRSAAVERGLISAAADDTLLRVDSTGLFKKGDFIPGIGYLFGATSFAFREEVGTVSDAMETSEAFFLLQVKRRTRKGILPFEEVRAKIVTILADSLSQQRSREYLETAAAKLDPHASLKVLGSPDSVIIVGTTDTVSRSVYIPSVGLDNEAVAVAFALPINTRSGVIKTTMGLFVVRPLWQQKVESIPWESDDISRIVMTLISQCRENIYYSWYLDYKNKSKVQDKLSEYYMD